MNRKLTLSAPGLFLLMVGAALVTFGLGRLAPSEAEAQREPGYIRRFAANFTAWGAPPELVTNEPALPGAKGGMVIYDKDFFTADDINVLYVTISATGDAHGGARLQLACEVDNTPCNPGPNPVGGAPNGWFTAQRHDNYNENYTGPGYGGDGGGGAGDLHDNVIVYTWCVPFEVKAGTHNVKVRMASAPVPGDPGSAGQPVFMEAVHFFIDGSRVADPTGRCTPLGAGGAPAPAGTGPAPAGAPGRKHGH